MKIKIIVFILLTTISWGQIVTYTPPSTTGVVAANATASTFNIGSGLNAGSGCAGNWYQGDTGSTFSTTAQAETGVDYYEFTATPNSGYQLDLSSVTVSGLRRSTTGPTSFEWAYRIGSGAWVYQGAATASGSGNCASAGNTNTWDFTDFSSTSIVTFRIIMYGASNTAGTYRMNVATLNGTVTSSPQPEINVTGNGANILDNSLLPSVADFTDFGASLVGVSVTRTFTIQNVVGATAPLNIAGISFTGANASDFVVTTNPASVLNAGTSSTFVVTFTPSATGVRSATLLIENDDINENPYDFAIQGTGNPCPGAPTISSVFPASGPVGTIVTINGTGLLGATAKFNGVTATVVSSTATQLFVTITAGATTGNLVVSNAALCPSTPVAFTIINTVNSGCQGTVLTDLCIYEVHDQFSGAGGTITIYNGTGVTKSMSDYRFYRSPDANTGIYSNYANLTGSIAPDALAVITVPSGTSCGSAQTNGTLFNGFNENDGLQLRASDGVTVIDDIDAYPTSKGYYMKRNTTVAALQPKNSYNASDWAATVPLSASPVCAPGFPAAKPSVLGAGTVPNITVQPTISLSCTSTTATLSINATEGYNLGGDLKELAYDWYAVAPNTAAWTLLTISGNYADTDSNPTTLNIAALSGLNGYQYYCRVKENDNTCYNATNSVQINNGTITWNGSDWRDTNNVVGVPSITKVATINGPYNTFTNGSFDCCSLVVNNGFTATIAANTYINVQNNVTMVGTGNLLVDDNGSLVQVSDSGVNTGAISVNRIHTVKKFDYVYLASPVFNFPLTSVSPTTSTAHLWKWIPTVGGFFGNWVNTTENMITGKGYIVRGPSGFDNTTAADYTVPYRNVPNNGIVNVDVERGGYTGLDYSNPNPLITDLVTKYDDNWNLIGNPYPSAVDAKAFMTFNTNIEGVIRIWTHGNLPSAAVTNPFYGSFAYNYRASDFILYNLTGPSVQNGYNGYVPSGQGFFVAMLDGPADATQKVIFNNAMRSKTFDNSQFFRLNSHSHTNSESDKSRIWLDLVGPNETVSRTMIGYVDGATTNKDRLYDASLKYGGNQDFYSLIEGEPMNIQGRPIPFDRRDRVKLGLKVSSNNTYKIAIASVDGLFLNSNRSIYIEDKELQIIHDLKQEPYTFTTSAGKFDNRFVLRYRNNALNNRESDEPFSSISVSSNSDQISIESSSENINSILIFDLLGRELYAIKDLNSSFHTVSNLNATQQTLIVKIILANGMIETRKILN